MKWIGQHVWDFISRFRSDVYLENISTGTIASGGNLGLDSNNKIVKADTEAGELTIANATDNRVVTSLGGTDLNAEANMPFDGNYLSLTALSSTFTNAVSSSVIIKNTGNSTAGGVLDFINERGTGVDGDNAGHIRFFSDDDGGNATEVATVIGSIGETADGSEHGFLTIKALTGGQQLRQGFILNSSTGNDILDCDIGYGATSTTTIAGDLDIDGDTITSAGALTIQPADISGQALIIDADADTDNEVEINAGLLDINTTAAITIDAATSISINSGHNLDIESGRSKINKIYDFHATTFENSYAADAGSGTIIKYSPASSSSLNGSEIYYLRSNGSWAQADADSASSSGPCILGVGLGGDPQTVGILLKGFVMVASTEILNTPTNVDGLPVYISTTAGHFDFTAPSGSGDVVRIVGYAIDDHLGDVLIYFDPDKTWVEIA